ncbi:hypothetical protein [Methanococcus aeolicus]|uniref:hypothetical protein n=1 Tax=Methanococcus aeolicus TaxID=42879 RepID=UPI00032261B8|nr:hypothetical protein [Methanococcus aeolicus]
MTIIVKIVALGIYSIGNEKINNRSAGKFLGAKKKSGIIYVKKGTPQNTKLKKI